MTKSRAYLIGAIVFGVLAIGLFPFYSKVLIKEGNQNAAPSPEVVKLTAEKQDFLERIDQLRPGGTLSGRLIDLQARRDQLVGNYPDGHPDINILDKQITELQKTLEKLPKLEEEYSVIKQKLDIAIRNSQPAAKEPFGNSLLNKDLFKAPRLHYEGDMELRYVGDAKRVDSELALLRQEVFIQFAGVRLEKVAGQPQDIVIQGAASSPNKLMKRLALASDAVLTLSVTQQKAALQKNIDKFKTDHEALKKRFARLTDERKAVLSGPISTTPNAQLITKIEALKARRRQLIENYPTHSDVVSLGVQIRTLLAKTQGRSPDMTQRISAYDRQLNETKVWMDYLGRRIVELGRDLEAVKSLWTVSRPAAKPSWPKRLEGWPFVGLGMMILVPLMVALVRYLNVRKKAQRNLVTNGVWTDPIKAAMAEKAATAATAQKAETAAAAETAVKAETAVPAEKVELEVVSPENLPADPLTQHAASLYSRWVEVAKLLYKPAAHAPEGILESVTPLLQESSEFLPEGHDVLARYLARSVEPGNLPAHVARTVLMALTGADEAGATPEHRYAMALAALFHDLAVVPRPDAEQDSVGSEVGRLSAVLLRRIPGLAPALLNMVEEILIGMDEHKLETWQNVAHGRTLEPLSKVLREIDRFEKVMQKQKARMQRQLKASNS